MKIVVPVSVLVIVRLSLRVHRQKTRFFLTEDTYYSI